MLALLTNLHEISIQATAKIAENETFRAYLQHADTDILDEKVHTLNNQITPLIDCTACGNCCRQLMINVTTAELAEVATTLQISTAQFEDEYIEKSQQGKMIMNSIPCHFLGNNKCSIYTNRFTECRAFPHLDKPNFKGRLFGTLMHYGMCPIVYNVIETLKVQLQFKIV